MARIEMPRLDHTVAAPVPDLRDEAAEQFFARVVAMHEEMPSEIVTLDLSQITRLERRAGALLSAVVLGSLGAAALVIRLPDEEKLEWLTASGLAFAVANRRGPTQIDGPLEFDLRQWTQPWSSGQAGGWPDAEPTEPLFGPNFVGETTLAPTLLGQTYAAFVDAHLAPPNGSPTHPLSAAVWPWLDRLLPGGGSRRHATDRTAYISEVGRLLTETVWNIREHARDGNCPLHSLVQLAVTRGGGQRSGNRLHLVVQDNGRGILATARPKVAAVSQAVLNDHQLLFKLCDGSLPPWGRARGQGLPRVVSTCRRLRGSLRIWTRTTRATAEAASPGLTTGGGPLRVDGTLLSITLPLHA